MHAQDWWYVQIQLLARLNRHAATDYLRKHLHEEQRYGPPGGHRGGGYVTSYKLTMDRIRNVLEWERDRRDSDGWMTVRDICARVETHYANPRASVAKALLNFEHEWCESKYDNGKLYFRLRREDNAGHASRGTGYHLRGSQI